MVGRESVQPSDVVCSSESKSQLFKIVSSETEGDSSGGISIDWNGPEIMLEKPCRVNYRNLEFDFGKNIIVNGRLPNGKNYPIWIDSGMVMWPTLVNDTVAKENGLVIPNGNVGSLPCLKIGELTLQNLPYLYVPNHWEFRVLGIPIWQDNRIVFGIEAMSQFRYLLFDNKRKQLEFSSKQSFQPEDPAGWAYYPFKLDKMGQFYGRRLIVNIPIAGEVRQVEFDTGGRDMAIGAKMWLNLCKKISSTKPKRANFTSHKYGLLPCHKVVVDELGIGNIVVKNAEIEILPEDSPYLLTNDPGQIGMGYFKNTKVVLDFERMLMWVKGNTKVDDQALLYSNRL
ncbi:MAG: hypothetical protein KAS75_07825 [Planctomycetes bacterium]|nr:hypothetical protein [Planctomycetota bacterium]